MKCPGCPVEGPCVGEREDHRFACRIARASAAETRWVVEESARRRGETPPESTAVVDAAAAGPPPTLRQVVAIQACTARGADPACRCPSMARCAKYSKDVTPMDCVACIEAGGADLPPVDE